MRRAPLSRRSSRRRGEGSIGAVAAVMLLLVVAAVYLGTALVPVWFDHMAVKEITRTVVLDWINHDNLKSARARFNAELKRKGVSPDIDETSCDFNDDKEAYAVECEWTQYAYYPGTSYYKAFPLYVHARLVDGEVILVGE